MQVKELINLLKKEDKNKFIFMYEVGQDTADLIDLDIQSFKDVFTIIDYKTAIRILKRQGDKDELDLFLKKYGEKSENL